MADDAQAQAVRRATDQLDVLVPQWLARTGVPGAAVAVVYRGQPIYARGFGVRRVGEDAPVDADTVFQLASVSKSVASTVMAAQMPGAANASGAAIDWNTPIERLMPDFRLAYPDPAENARLTLGNLFSHRSGLPDHAGDQLEDLGYSRAAILQRLRYAALHPKGDYAYTNFGLTAAAQAMADARGADWAALSEQSIYRPLGMSRTSSRFSDFAAHDNRAWGHVQIDSSYDTYGQFPARYEVQLPPREPDAQAPAGGVSASVNDLARWMQLVLAGGQWQGRQLLGADALRAALTAQPGGKYGYGFNSGPDPSGHASISHSGAFMLGAATTFVLWPEAELGIVVLTNAQPRGLPEAIALKFGETALGAAPGKAPDTDWLAFMQPQFHEFYKPLGRLAGQAPPANPAPARPLASYAGTYANAYYGSAQIALAADGQALELTLGPAAVRHRLRHWDGDVFAFDLGGENAPAGSVSAVDFAPRSMQIEYFDEDLARGRFERAPAS